MVVLATILTLAGCSGRQASTRYDVPQDLHEVRFRPEDPSSEAGRMLVDAVPLAQWDRGLEQAASELLSVSTNASTLIDPRSQSLALARAGYPGQARFARLMNGGAFPADLADQAALSARTDVPVHVALASRQFGDGTTLWIVAWCPQVANIDPIPRDLALDDTLALRVDEPDGGALRLYMAPPTGPVDELQMTSGVSRWVDRFHEPGVYRLEVVRPRGDIDEIVFLFSIYVDTEPQPVSALPKVPEGPPNPIEAEAWLFDALNETRVSRGLAKVAWFPLFNSLAREHSAFMAATTQVGHRIPGTTEGVAERAGQLAHPRAEHHENVAAAPTAAYAHALVVDSPGHLRNLLCEDCTHAVVGAALEPVLDRPPRLFVTWEILAFPAGVPQAIDHYNR